MAKWSDWLTGYNPYLRLPTCRSAMQLTCQDADNLIAELNLLDIQQPHDVPILSVSGGQPFLEVGERWKANLTASVSIQRLLAKPNDGLVPETSSDITQVLGSRPGLTHRNNYSEYANINHTELVRNQEIAQLLVDWCQAQLSANVP
jgi:hypothetical protein